MAHEPVNPPHPERVCWGCEQRCPAKDLACGNGSIRTPHPAELFGDDWNAPRVAPSREVNRVRDLVYPQLGRDQIDFSLAYGRRGM